MKKAIVFCVAALPGATASDTAAAFDQGDWLIHPGGSNVDPGSDCSPLAWVDSATSATLNCSYMLTDNGADMGATLVAASEEGLPARRKRAAGGPFLSSCCGLNARPAPERHLPAQRPRPCCPAMHRRGWR